MRYSPLFVMRIAAPSHARLILMRNSLLSAMSLATSCHARSIDEGVCFGLDEYTTPRKNEDDDIPRAESAWDIDDIPRAEAASDIKEPKVRRQTEDALLREVDERLKPERELKEEHMRKQEEDCIWKEKEEKYRLRTEETDRIRKEKEEKDRL